MFSEFGQSPLCLKLDLDSYEGDWTHVAAFRGRGGWLMAARATIQSEHDLMRATLFAACDEYENPIPAWRAEHLTACDWKNLEECRELPPDLLDDLLCEEEGAFFARWQRETNGELVQLHERAQHDLAALDARAVATQRQADREIADLQRRRRQADATPDHRAALSHLIAQIEADSDAAVHAAATRRAALRREIDAAEEALWDRGDVLMEVEPLWCIQWQASEARRSRPVPLVGGNRARIDGGKPLVAPGQVAVSLIVEPPPKTLSAFTLQKTSTRAPLPKPVDPREAELAALRARLQRLEDEPALALHGSTRRLAIQRGMLTEEIARLTGALPPPTSASDAPTPPAAAIQAPPPSTPAILAPAAPIVAVPLATSPDPLAAKQRERRLLQQQLDATILAGERFRSGSPKFRHHQEIVADLRRRLSSIDAALGGPASQPTRETLAEDCAALAAELASHEKRGALESDGARRLPIYAARRQDLLGKVARLDHQLAPAPTRANAPGVLAPDPALLEALAIERARLAADLDLHERSGVLAQDDLHARIRFNARQAELAAQLARADAKLAHARAVSRTLA